VSARFTLGPAKEAPYLIAALLCERVLQETDGSLSAIRLIDQVTLSPVPPNLSADVEIVPPRFTAALLISLKGGASGVQHKVGVVAHSPGGPNQSFPAQPITLGSTIPGAVPGANLVVQLQAGLRHEGIYWFEVRLDGRRLTAIPLRVVFSEAVPGSPQQGSASRVSAPLRRRAGRSKPKPGTGREKSSSGRKLSGSSRRQAKRE
jgi:Family of unknown function (DUF6941)